MSRREPQAPPEEALLSSEALLRESQDLLDLAQEAGGLGIFEWRVREGLVRLSPRFLALYGITDFDGRYDSWLASLFREDVPRVVDLIERTFAARQEEWRADFRIARPGEAGLRWMEARSRILYDAEGRPVRVVGVHVDVTERKRAALQQSAFTQTLEERVRERTHALEAAHEARGKAEESLRQAQKMEAVGQLTGGVAHDFNNLLTVILGGLEVIGRQLGTLGESPAVARMQRARDMAMQGVQRAATLTARLLAFARRQPLAPRALDCNKLVAEVAELLRRTLGGAVALETVLAGGLWRTYADANQLENALLNLAVNARDAMANGGKLTIETANCHLDQSYVAGIAEPVELGQYVMVAVSDTGVGMTKAVLERAFEPFFTTKEAGKGTGLGLSQVYGFVRQSGGHVRIYSEVGEGTTVKIYLPRHLGADALIEELEALPAAAKTTGAESILVVEDDDDLRAHTVEVLGELGYRVLAASSGAAALEILDREGRIDLLFTDVVMPGGLNGAQLAQEAKRRRPALKVLFTTGYARNAIFHHGRLDPGLHMIGKPFSLEQLSAAVRSLLDERA